MGLSTPIFRALALVIRRPGAALLLLGGLALSSPRALAQLPSFEVDGCGLLMDDFKNVLNQPSATVDSLTATPISRVPRLRLFRFAPGFLADPLGMLDDDSGMPGMPGLAGASPAPTTEDSGPEWIQFGMGSDNPYVDLRLPGDPGGYGYSRVNTQVSLLDSQKTACSFGVQAVTPTGAQFGGLPDGPTVVIPDFSVFHALNDRLALQGFVSKNVPISDASGTALQRNVQYGLALQRPLFDGASEGWRNLFVTVGALGQLAPDGNSLRLVPNYDVEPGFQWHVNDSWWLSSAMLMPVGTVRTSPGQWQLSCSLQF
ncbi:MAG TPA: hypothetical protein VMF69_16810 [Gemmataceae bacterium]|nr:hypothetical protein [Gemmataceae bacterium]